MTPTRATYDRLAADLAATEATAADLRRKLAALGIVLARTEPEFCRACGEHHDRATRIDAETGGHIYRRRCRCGRAWDSDPAPARARHGASAMDGNNAK